MKNEEEGKGKVFMFWETSTFTQKGSDKQEEILKERKKIKIYRKEGQLVLSPLQKLS